MTSGMLSNFIARLQASQYQGEKFARPKRQSTLRAAQSANMNRPNKETPTP